jgi:lipid-binding SYLF domain-containing protein
MRLKRLVFATVVAVVLATVVSMPVDARVPLDQKVRAATQVYEELMKTRDRKVPDELLEDSACVAVIPGVIKGAIGWGGRHGRGVLSCRNDAGSWSPPIFITLGGGSFGLQIGAQSTDVVLFFMTERSARSLLKSKFTLGGDASVAAGPVGRSAEVATDVRLRAEIYSYAKSRGLFAGIALQGARLSPHQKSIDRYYGERVWPDQVLFEHKVPKVPRESRDFIDALP